MNPEGTVYKAVGKVNSFAVMTIDAYGVAVKNGFEGTEEEWLESLRGSKIVSTEYLGVDESGNNLYEQTFDNGHTSIFAAPKGAQGIQGEKGAAGKTAYEYAKDGGFAGTETEFAELMANPGSGGGTQSDWNQTDSSAADFIKNKPFGDEPAVILEEQELVYDAGQGGCFGEVSAPINDGDQLTVVYDGESYECTAVMKPEMGFIVFGNLSPMGGDDTGEPFACVTFESMLLVTAVNLNDTQNHTVKISGTVPKKIDPKYLKTFSKIYLSQGSTADRKYLCSDPAGTMPISKADLVEAAKLPILLSLGDSIIFYPVAVVPSAGDYGYIAIRDDESSVTYYTAESTG